MLFLIMSLKARPASKVIRNLVLQTKLLCSVYKISGAVITRTIRYRVYSSSESANQLIRESRIHLGGFFTYPGGCQSAVCPQSIESAHMDTLSCNVRVTSDIWAIAPRDRMSPWVHHHIRRFCHLQTSPATVSAFTILRRLISRSGSPQHTIYQPRVEIAAAP